MRIINCWTQKYFRERFFNGCLRYRFIKLNLRHKPSSNCKTTFEIFLLFQVSCNFTRKKERKLLFFKKPCVLFFVFNRYFYFHKRLIRFVNDIRINGFCRSLTDWTSVSQRLTKLCPALFSDRGLFKRYSCGLDRSQTTL